MALDKLVDSTQLDGAMTYTADAIRAKTGGSSAITWDTTYGFKAAIENIPTGGGAIVIEDETDEHGGTVRTVIAQDVYVLQDKANVSPTESSQTITPDTGYNAMTSVQINAISSTYVGSGITRRDSTDLSASGATVSVPAGYYASAESKSVASGTEGTPVATKGTVSNNSISVTPSVTNSAGYISGSTKTGTAVTVTASELVSGNKAITSAGTGIDVANYATASVASGSVTAPATISGSSASIGTSTNTITLTKTVSVTPNVTTAGYISSGTAGNASVSLSASVTTKAATTYHPSTTDQTISSGSYTTGTQTFKAVTVSGLSADKVLSGTTVKIGDSTDDDCVTSVSGSVVIQHYYTGSTEPSSSLGSNGDIYLKT